MPFKKGTIRGDGEFASPERVEASQPCWRDCATASGTAWEAAAGTHTGRDGPPLHWSPAAKSGPSHSEKFPNKSAAAGCGAANCFCHSIRGKIRG